MVEKVSDLTNKARRFTELAKKVKLINKIIVLIIKILIKKINYEHYICFWMDRCQLCSDVLFCLCFFSN